MKLVRNSRTRYTHRALAESGGPDWRWAGKVPGDGRQFYLELHSDKHYYTVSMSSNEATEFGRFVDAILERDGDEKVGAQLDAAIPV